MEGFGVSGAWWAQHLGQWQESETDQLLKWLFSQEEGIGLSIYRYNIGAGSGDEIQDDWRRSRTMEIAEGEYDWSRDAAAITMMKRAVGYGARQIVAFANSAPARMTRSGMTSGNPDSGRSNFAPGMERQFARYLVDIVRYLREEEGLPVEWLSPINEPMWLWHNAGYGQEGCHYTPEENVNVLRAVAEEIASRGLDVKISALEAGEWTSARMYYYKLEADPDLLARIDNISLHSYVPHVTNEVYREELAQYIGSSKPGMKLWMSEWTEMQGGQDYTMESALELARVLHDDLVYGQVTSWQYWIAVSRYDFRDGLVYLNETDRSLRDTKRLWVLGQYSKFIRPGFTRLEAIAEHGGLKVTAFMRGDAEVVFVVINDGDEDILSTIDHALAGSIQATIVVTSEQQNMDTVHVGALPGTWLFGARSVTTIVIKSI